MPFLHRRLTHKSMAPAISSPSPFLALLLLIHTVSHITTATDVTTTDTVTAAPSIVHDLLDVAQPPQMLRQATMPSPTPVSGTLVLSFIAGSDSEPKSALSGVTGFYNRFFPIAGTESDLTYSRHVYGADFTYTLSVPANLPYIVTVLLAESFSPACKPEFRVFNIAVYDPDNAAGPTSGVTEEDIDIFSRVGCRTALQLALPPVSVGPGGRIAVRFTAQKDNAIFSGIQIRTTDPDFNPSLSPSPMAAMSSTPAPSGLVEQLNIAATDSAPAGVTLQGSSSTFTQTMPIAGTDDNALFASHRYGRDFRYEVVLSPGTYLVKVLLAESYARGCFTGFRIFDVIAFDGAAGEASAVAVRNLDVFRNAGCKTAYSVSLPNIVIPENGGPLVIRFLARRNNAMLSGFQVFSGAAAVSAAPSPSASPVVVAPSLSASPSIAISAMPSASTSPSADASPSASASVEPSPSSSASASASASTSILPSPSAGALPSASTSADPTPSTSPSASPSASTSIPPSPPVLEPSPSSSPSPSVTASASAAADPSPSPSGSSVPVSPAASIEPTTDTALVNAGSPTDENIVNTTRISTEETVVGTANIPAENFQSARVGKNFRYTFDLKAGAYDIVLGFAELDDANNCVLAGKRAFNVYINDALQLEGFDIFEEAGCQTGIEKNFTQSVSVVLRKPLVIRFESIVGEALISYVSITPAADTCVPESTTGELDSDHAAHAVPGTYPPQLNANSPTSFVDSDGDGFVTVNIDGQGSHSHFFDSANNIAGRITKYTWSLVETGEVISNEVQFSYRFPLGTTRLRLAVIDNSCTTDEAETTVTVVGAIQPGQYCYYYSGLTEVPVGGTIMNDPRPQFAAISSTLDLNFPDFSFSDTAFAARCFFFFEKSADGEVNTPARNISIERPTSTLKIETLDTGIGRVYRGEDLILDTQATNETSVELPVGLTRFEVTYLRTDMDTPPRLRFLIDGAVPPPSKVSHDRAAVVPIITGIDPTEGNIAGGTRVKVSGYGLFQPMNVTIGGNQVSVLSNGITPNQFFFDTPSVPQTTVAPIIATNLGGIASNTINFAYGSSCDSIAFSNIDLTQPNGDPVNNLQLPTCVTVGHDQRLYMGTLDGSVQVVSYDRATLQTTNRCYSKVIRDSTFTLNGNPSVRGILGIAFDPRDSELRPYVSTSTLFHSARNRRRINNGIGAAWRNGAIDRLRPGTDESDPNICLVYDQRIVTGLPVSNHDHAVNALLFTQDGDLLIAVGGSTNMGLPGYRLGTYWESPLSGAIVVARLSKSGFDGTITYSGASEPFTAQKTGGDVDVFASGLRNCYAMAMDAVGNIYASDQSNNCGFGNAAVSCSDFNLTAAEVFNSQGFEDWPGQINFTSECRTSGNSRPDKIVYVEEGKFYGHANIQRGGGECAWIDPFTNVASDGSAPPSNYMSPVVTVRSPATGLGQYRANHFCGRLRGQLLTSAYQGRGVRRIAVNGPTRVSGPDLLTGGGGISFVENAHGELLFPRLSQQRLSMLRPNVSPQAGVYIAGVSPFRHGLGGGNPITIGGFNFGVAPNVTIGTTACAVTLSSETEIVCTVPAASSGGPQDLTVLTANGESQKLEQAVLYMNV